MNVLKNSMMRREDSLVIRSVIGVLTAPLGLLLGMGLVIAL